MTLPANVRINTLVPFPSLVQGSGPITVTKVNGIWTVGLSFNALGQQAPPTGSFATDFVLVYDSLNQTAFKTPLANLVGFSRTQRAVSSGPVTLLNTDQVLNFNLSAPTTITLPTYTGRSGIPFTFKDIAGKATANPITFNAAAGEFIDGNASIVLNTNYQSITITPANDLINTGWLET